jgi:hypothetical protein
MGELIADLRLPISRGCCHSELGELSNHLISLAWLLIRKINIDIAQAFCDDGGRVLKHSS